MDAESQATEFHGVKVFADYSQKFYSANEKALGNTAATWGGMLMGAMRAILECPNHPGKFRIPQDDNWDVLVCPECGVWTRRDESEKQESPKKKKHKS